LAECSASATPSTSRAQTVRETAPATACPPVCPTEAIAASIARDHGLGPMDYVAMREAYEEAIGIMAHAFGGPIGEKTKAMHFQRLVDALATSARNAGRLYRDRVTEARSHPGCGTTTR
jgi:hypothetical protein